MMLGRPRVDCKPERFQNASKYRLASPSHRPIDETTRTSDVPALRDLLQYAKMEVADLTELCLNKNDTLCIQKVLQNLSDYLQTGEVLIDNYRLEVVKKTLNKEVEHLTAENSRLRNRLEQLDGKYRKSLDDCLRSDNQSKKHAIEKIEKELSRAVAKCARYEETLKEKKKKAGNNISVSGRKTDFYEKYMELFEVYKALKLKYNLKVKKVEECKKMITLISARNEELSKQAESLEDKLRITVKSSKSNERETRQLNVVQENEEMKLQISNAKKERDKLRADKIAILKENKQLRADVEKEIDKRRKLEEMFNKIDSIEHIESLNKGRPMINEEERSLRGQIDNLKEDLMRTEEEIKSKEEKLVVARSVSQEHIDKQQQETAILRNRKESEEQKLVINFNHELQSKLGNDDRKLELQLREEVERLMKQHSTSREELERAKFGLQKQVESLQKQCSHLQQVNARLSEDLQQEKGNLRKKEDELKDTQRKIDALEKELKLNRLESQDRNSCLRLSEIELQRFKEKHVKIQTEVDNIRLENKKLEEKIYNYEQSLTNEQNISATLKEENRRIRKTIEELSADNKLEPDLKQQCANLKEQLKNAQREVDETKSRLSRAMGDKLTDNNPNIADLSDKNRPTKISERYQELYDNQWTDSFEVIFKTFGKEELTIKVLKDILTDTREFCKLEAAKQIKNLSEALSTGKELPSNIMKQLKDTRKTLAESYGKELYVKYIAQVRRSQSDQAKMASKVPDFLKECFEICWLMAVQDPPVVLGPEIRKDSAFNKDHYKVYTKGGDTVKYIVWPVLLLHENGPVLCKGVAQG